MCLNPQWIYKKGNYKENNYRGKKGQFYELGTYSKCGHCTQCISEKANNWVVRNYYEEKKHQDKCFITLTYKKSPIILVRKDLTNFIKRLRKELNKENKKIRIFAAGEYGSKGRPHYHVIIYGWKDDNAKYLDINKRRNIILKSNIIEKTWGIGRTSYQEFNSHEVPYISLYNTPKETFKKAYKMNLKKLNELEKYAKNLFSKEDKKNQLNNLLAEIKEIRENLNKNKKKYMLIKEFNTWSIALGWEVFEKEYYKTKEYTWKEYIENKEFVTPSPWVKKLANLGNLDAAEEMLKREREIENAANEELEKAKNLAKLQEKKKKELKDHQTQKDKFDIE